MASSVLNSLGAILLPKGKGTKGGASFTTTFNPSQPVLTAPLYRDHLTDLFQTRTANDSRTLIATLANADPDLSGAITAFLSIAGSIDPVIYAYDANDQIDTTGIAQAQQLWSALTTTNDYTIGYSAKSGPDALVTDLRYMILLRGMVAGELVLDKTYVPSDIRLVDPATLVWNEPQSGVFQPQQKTSSNVIVDLNIPTFFTENFHQSPLSVYTYSPFVSAINTIASRTQVIQELYRIMKIVGYPRVDVGVLDDVLVASAPAAFKNDPLKMRAFVEGEIGRIRSAISNLGSGDAFVHSKAVEAKILNDKNPGAGLQIQGMIDVLQSQNLAALKVMPSVVGRGNNGQVASTEARLFAMNADALNRSIGSFLSKLMTLALRLSGYQGRVEVIFPPVELRPRMELEPQLTMKSSRLKQDLSLGLITDAEYSIELYGRPPIAGAPVLSGTGFMEQAQATVDVEGVSANDDSLGRSLSGEGGNGVARSKAVAKPKGQAGKFGFETEVTLG